MNTYRSTAIVVGILFIIATLFLFFAEAIYGPYLGSTDYLALTYPNRRIVAFGLLLEFVCVIVIPLIPVVLYPLLRKYGESLAIGYVVFRLFEAVLFAGVVIKRFSLISVSQGYLNADEGATAYFQNLGRSIQAENLWAFSIYVLVFAIGGLIFYYALYRSKLVPAWLSVWGLLAAAIMLVGTLLTLLEMLPGDADVAQLIIVVPIALNEMVLAIWLIVKGFSPAAVAPASPQMRVA